MLYSKEIIAIIKTYIKEQKYDGHNNSFDFKLNIFYNICSCSGLPTIGYAKAFPTILKGLALTHYYNSGLRTYAFKAACDHVRNFFKGLEYYQKNLIIWNSITLQGTINKNPGKSVSECLQLLIDKLCKQQHTIDPVFRTPYILTNKLVTACQGVLACRIAVSNLLNNLSILINTL